MRERFVHVTSELLDQHEGLALVLAEIGVGLFKDAGVISRHPERVINVGIREQLMVSVAAGMALEGFRPIIHSYAPFAVERPYEQLKLDFEHQGVSGTVVSVGASYDSAASGRTHQAPEDVALVRTLPGWDAHVPGHPVEAEAVLRAAVASQGSAYVRLSDEANLTARRFKQGSLHLERTGSTHAPTILAVGPMLDTVLAATADIDVTVLYAITVRPLDGRALRELISVPDVVLVEPYLAGTSVPEVSAALSDTPHRLLGVGVPLGEHRKYGTAAEHNAAHGLDESGIRASIAGFIKNRVSVQAR